MTMPGVRPVASYACSVMDLIESRLKEYCQDHGRAPKLIHLTLATSQALAREIVGDTPPPYFPKNWHAVIRGGDLHGVPVATCSDSRCQVPDAFIDLLGGDFEQI